MIRKLSLFLISALLSGLGFAQVTTDTTKTGIVLPSSPITNYAWAGKPAATAVATGTRIRISDAGITPGLIVVSDGARWIPDGPQVLARSSVPVGIAPSGSVANNGSLTFTTALDLTYTAGLYMYYPASAIVAGGAAGFYWTVMSSSTVGTIFNNTYSPTAGALPTVPASNTAFSTTGPGAFTGVIAAQDLFTLTVPGGLLGIRGNIRASYSASFNNTAGAKNANTKFGGSVFHGITATTGANMIQQIRFSNRGAANAQVVGSGQSGAGFGVAIGAAPSLFAIDTAAAQTLAMNFNHAVATDWLILQDLMWELMP